jgi:two-component system sensor histidine kinase UhpB
VTRRLKLRKNTVVEDERKAISIEIHDVLNAILIGIRLDSQAILSSMTQAQHTPLMDEVVERAKSIAAHANDLYAACRAIVTRLRPEVLDVLGLDEAIEEMVKTYNATHPACTFTFHFDGSTAGVDPNIGIAAYRIVQEALSNVVKHANAHHADVSLKVLDDELRLAIEDDGRGFSEQQDAAAGFGLVGMRERADAFGGSLEIHSARNDGGSRIVARIPLKPQQTGVTN